MTQCALYEIKWPKDGFTNSYDLFDPSGTKTGKMDAAWKLRMNISTDDIKTHLTLWNKFHELVQELFRLKSWERLYETDIFAVKSPETDKEYFISIMGRLREVFALAAYEGAAGLAKFRDIQNSGGNVPPETVLTIPHFMISLNYAISTKLRSETFVYDRPERAEGSGGGHPS